MIRNLKVLGLALAAVFAMTAVAASAAQAEELFHSDLTETTLTGTQKTENVFSTSAGTVKCTTATFHALVKAKTTTEITVTPTYKNCTAFGFVNATVNFGTCDYVFTSDGTVKVHVVCPSGDVTINAFTCVVHVPAQTPTTAVVDYVNGTSGGKGDVTVTSTVKGIKYSATSGCPGGANEKDDGEYTGSVTVTGESPAGVPTNISWG